MGPDQQPLPPTAPLPAYIPSLATVSIGKDDGWPYKVVLVGRVPSTMLQEDTRRRALDGSPLGTRNTIQKVQPSRIVLTYSNVQINPTLKPEEFAFQAPPGAHVEDNTDTLLSMLEQALQAQIAQKRAAAAKEAPPLDQAIDVPKPDAAPAPPSSLPPAGASPTPAPR